MPIEGTTAIPPLASTSDMESEAEGVLVTPSVVVGSPSVAKAYGTWNASGTLDSGSYRIESITDNGTGDHTVNFSTDFSSASYSAIPFYSSSTTRAMAFTARATGSVQIYSRDASGNLADVFRFGCVCFGDT